MDSDKSRNQRSPARDGLWLGVLVAAFAVSRIIFHHLGIRFDMTSLQWYWQYIDPNLLRTRLLESTYYLHSQPPLFNLFLGGVLKLFPGQEAAAFAWTYRSFGLILAISMYLLMRGFKVRASISLILSLAFAISPTCVLFENWLFYAYPLAVLLCLAALFLQHYARSGRIASLLVFFVFLAMVVLTRSLFHLVWFLTCFFVVLVHRRHEWRRVVLACLVPLVLVCALYFKNLILFDTFAGSTWMGMSLSKMTTFRIPEDDRKDLIRRGALSDLSLVKPFSSIHLYKDLVAVPGKTGIPVLDQEKKIGANPRRNTNFNNLIFVDISKQYLGNAIASLRLHPLTYLHTVGLAAGIYFRPASEYMFFEGNRAHIRTLDNIYNRAVYGQLFPHNSRNRRSGKETRNDLARLSRMGFLLALGFATFLVTGWRHLRPAGTGGRADPASRLTLLFIYLTVIYLTAVACLVEIGENNRFRFAIDPLIVVGLGLFLNDLVNRIRDRSVHRVVDRASEGGQG